MVNRKAFTLIEVLISIALMGLILVPLFNVVEMMRNSNAQLLHALDKSTQITKATKVLFQDIMASDGNFTIKKDEMSRFCMAETTNSLYELPVAKVCWLVLKEKNTLVRIEGNSYKLPLGSEDRVETDKIMSNIEIFDVYREKGKDKVLVVVQQKDKEAISFLVQGIYKPKPKIDPKVALKGFPKGTKISKDGKSIILPDGRRFPIGSRMHPNGTVMPPLRKGAKRSMDTRGKTRPNPSTRKDIRNLGGR